MLAALAEREGYDSEEAVSMATVAIAAIRGLLLQEVLAPAAHAPDAVALILRVTKGGRAERLTAPQPLSRQASTSLSDARS